jgi:5-methylcytosine-specific restriction endonuclease McrA
MRIDLLRAHGTIRCYWRGCVCGLCLSAKAEYARRWRADHPEEARKSNQKYYAANREKEAVYARAYRQANPEKMEEMRRRWRKANPDKAAVHARRYNDAHLVERATRCRARKARLRNADGTHTAADVCAQIARQRGRCYWCGVGTEKRYHVDHVMPLAKGGSNGPENIVIACPSCNCRKGSRHPMDFAGVLW